GIDGFLKDFRSMQSQSRSANQIEANPYNILPSAECSVPWWRSPGLNYIPPAVIGGNTPNYCTLEQSEDVQSQSDGGLDEEDDDVVKQSQITASPHSGRMMLSDALAGSSSGCVA
ncbi:hypothetical protein U1Q18_047790, partial [Sarracenia purpurea var. burkii]